MCAVTLVRIVVERRQRLDPGAHDGAMSVAREDRATGVERTVVLLEAGLLVRVLRRVLFHRLGEPLPAPGHLCQQLAGAGYHHVRATLDRAGVRVGVRVRLRDRDRVRVRVVLDPRP